MRSIPPRVPEPEEQLPSVQVTPYLAHNSLNLPRHLLHCTLRLLLGGDGFGQILMIVSRRNNCAPVK